MLHMIVYPSVLTMVTLWKYVCVFVLSRVGRGHDVDQYLVHDIYNSNSRSTIVNEEQLTITYAPRSDAESDSKINHL
jgi:hypothetical protein